LTHKIPDTNFIIDELKANTLEDFFKEISEQGDKIWIPPDVHRELQEKLEDDQRILFDNLLKQGIKERYVIDSRHKFRLKTPFKELAQDLRMFNVRLQRTDRNLIALKFQIKGEILTNDDGIKKALHLLRTKNSPWRRLALSMDTSPAENFVKHKKNYEG